MEVGNLSGAEDKFWETPELLETLFSLLDLDSILNLARVMDKEIFKSGMTSKAWNMTIKHNCPVDVRGRLFGGFLVDRDSFQRMYHELKLQEARLAMKNLATILKLMGQPKDLLLNLLDVICEGLPPVTGRVNQLEIVCPRHPDPHNISPAGFLLPEEVESVLRTTEQRIQSMEVGFLCEATISAIGSRMSRQQEPVASIRIRFRVDIESGRGAQAFFTLMSGQVEHQDEQIDLVVGSLGGDGWEAVAKAIQLQPNLVSWVKTSKPSVAEAKMDDIKDILGTEGLDGFKIFQTTAEVFERFSDSYFIDDCKRLEQLLDMDWAEFGAMFKEEEASSTGEEDEEQSLS